MRERIRLIFSRRRTVSNVRVLTQSAMRSLKSWSVVERVRSFSSRRPTVNNGGIRGYQRKRPTPYVYAVLSKHVYEPNIQPGAPVKFKSEEGKPYDLGDDWKVERVYRKQSALDTVYQALSGTDQGYFGVVYTNEKSRQRVLAHRGTQITNESAMVTNAHSIAGIGGIMQASQKEGLVSQRRFRSKYPQQHRSLLGARLSRRNPVLPPSSVTAIGVASMRSINTDIGGIITSILKSLLKPAVFSLLTSLERKSVKWQEQRLKEIIWGINDNTLKVLEPSDKEVLNLSDVAGDTPLHHAIKKGRFRLIQLILDFDDIDLLACNNEGRTVFYEAAARGQTYNLLSLHDYVMRRKSKGEGGGEKQLNAMLNKPDIKGWTPLCSAIAHNHLTTAMRLLEYGSDPNPADKEGRTALFWAVKRNMIAVVKKLLSSGVFLGGRGEDGGNIFHVIARSSRSPLTAQQPDNSVRAREKAPQHPTLVMLDALLLNGEKSSVDIKHLLQERATEACNLDIFTSYDEGKLRNWKEKAKVGQVLFVCKGATWQAYWKRTEKKVCSVSVSIEEHQKIIDELKNFKRLGSDSREITLCKIRILKILENHPIFDNYKPIKLIKSLCYGRNPLHEACVHGNVDLVKRILRLTKGEQSLLSPLFVFEETLSGRNCLELIKIYGGYRENSEKFKTVEKYNSIVKLLEKHILGEYEKRLEDKSETYFLEKARLLAGLSLHWDKAKVEQHKEEFKTIIKGLRPEDLLKNGKPKEDKRGYTLLHYVLRFNDVAMVKDIIGKYKKLNERVPTEEARDFINHYNKEKTYGTALFDACIFGVPDIVKLLIDEDASVDVTDVRGEVGGGMYCATPLLGAVHAVRKEELNLVLRAAKDKLSRNDYEAYINQITHFNISALQLVVNAFYHLQPGDSQSQRHLMGIVEVLITEGLNVGLTFTRLDGTSDKSALHIAARQNNTELIRLLISKGSNVNSQDQYHCTPLHYACLKGNYEAAVILIQEGKADVFQVNRDGLTPYDLCIDIDKGDLKDYLWMAMQTLRGGDSDRPHGFCETHANRSSKVKLGGGSESSNLENSYESFLRNATSNQSQNKSVKTPQHKPPSPGK